MLCKYYPNTGDVLCVLSRSRSSFVILIFQCHQPLTVTQPSIIDATVQRIPVFVMSVYTIRNLRRQATADHDSVQAERDGVTATSTDSPLAAHHTATSTSSSSQPSPFQGNRDNGQPLTSAAAPSPAIDSVLHTSLLGFARSNVTILLYFFFILLLYFGGSAQPLQYLGRLHVLVVNLDSSLPSGGMLSMGQTLSAVISGLSGDHLGYTLHSAADYASIDEAVEAAYEAPRHSQYWASLLVRPNATTQWLADTQAALRGTPVTVPASSNVLLIVETARNSFLYGNYILSQVNPTLGQSTGTFQVTAGRRLLSLIAGCSNASQCTAAFLSQPPPVQSYLLNPMVSTEVDVAPAAPFVGTVATTLGLVIQWIFGAAVVGTTIGNSQRLVSSFSVWKVVLLRIVNTLLMTLALAGLFVGMVAWWAEGSYDGSTIGVYWMFAWLYMSTFCMFNIVFSLNLGVFADLTGVLFLFLNVVSSTNQLPVQLQQRFYTIGVGLPLYNAIVGSRNILMGGRQEDIGVNVGVLFAWLIGCSLFNLAVDSRHMYNIKQQQPSQVQQQQQPSPTSRAPLPVSSAQQ